MLFEGILDSIYCLF